MRRLQTLYFRQVAKFGSLRTTYRMRGMVAPQVVGMELSRLAVDQDLSWEHKVKIGVQKGIA